MMVVEMATAAAREGARVRVMSGKSNAGVKRGGVLTVTPATSNPDPGNEVFNANSGDCRPGRRGGALRKRQVHHPGVA